MAKIVRVKNVSDVRVGIVGFGDILPGKIAELPAKAWKALHKPWPNSRPYRCELVDHLVVVDTKGNIVTKSRRAKKTLEKPKQEPPKEQHETERKFLSTSNFPRKR